MQRLAVALERDGFAKEQPIQVDKRLARVAFTLENRTGDGHTTELALRFPYGSTYTLLQDGREVPLAPTGDWDYPWRASLAVTAAGAAHVELVKRSGVSQNPSSEGQ